MKRYNTVFAGSLKSNTPFTAVQNLSLTYVKAIYDGDDYSGLFNNDELVAILHISFERLNVPQITFVQTKPEFRGKGLLRYLINQVLTRFNEIYSDTHQTPESKHFWKNMIKFPGSFGEILVYDSVKNAYTKAKDYPETDIWNQQENPVLLIRKVSYNKEQMESIERNNNIKKKHKRDHDEIWYGHYTKDLGYENP